MDVPWRREFDAARDPYTARVALGITAAGGGGVSSINGETGTITLAGGAGIAVSASAGTITVAGTLFSSSAQGDVPASGGGTANFLRADGTWATPTGGISDAPSDGVRYVRQNATWTSGDAVYQSLDADLTSIAGYSGTGAWLYRSAADTWSAVTVGSGLTFTSGTLSATSSASVTPPQRTVLKTGTNATYTTPAGTTWLELELVGGGGGGSGSGAGPLATAGGATAWSLTSPATTSPLYQAGGGAAGQTFNLGGAGGIVSGSATALDAMTGGGGSAGAQGDAGSNATGGAGGVNWRGGNASAQIAGGASPVPSANSGAGGVGGAAGPGALAGSGGGAGAALKTIITNPAATYFYTVGVGGAGSSGTVAGGTGAAGIIIVTAHFGG